MAKEHEYGYKVRLLRIMRAIMDRPKGYTKKKLAELYGVNEDTIKNDFEALKSAGFLLEYDEKYRYYFIEEKPYKQLKDLLHFSEEDQLLLEQAIDQIAIHDIRGERLKKKLSSLYDFQRLGHAYLRKPYLNKVDLLMEAKETEVQIVLEDYHSSNSNQVTDRLVEPFHVSPPEDTLQAFDVDKRGIRHFRISRIRKVKPTENKWEFKGNHNIMRTDPFRIVDNNQKMVHLRMKVGAYNELIERFPLTKSYIQESPTEELYDFQCMVNHRFLGLANFIMGNYHHLVDVIAPDELVQHLKEEIEKLKF